MIFLTIFDNFFKIFFWPLLRPGNERIGSKKIFRKNIFSEKTYFFRGRKPAQKDKRLYPNSSPRSGTKFEKKIFPGNFDQFFSRSKIIGKTQCNFKKVLKTYGFLTMAMARPFGARRAGPPLPGVERKYWKSSQEKVSRKTILYFFEKHSKRSETYLERQISSRGSGCNFFHPKLIGNR